MPAKKKADHRLQGRKSPLRPTRNDVDPGKISIGIPGLLPIERVKREKTTRSHRPRGASRPGRDSLGGKNPGFRSACPASARHRSPNPSPKTESQLKRGQPNSFPTRPDGRTAASGCPALGGMPPWAPANSLPAGEDPGSSKSSSSTHSIGRRLFFF